MRPFAAKTAALERHPPEAGSTPSPNRRSSVAAAILFSAAFWFCSSSLGILTLVPVIGKRHESVIYVLLAGAILGATRWRRLPAISASILLGLWLVVCFTPLASRLALPLKTVTSDSLLRASRADAVVVLSADIQRDNEFDDTSLPRFLGGLSVVRRGLAPTLVLTELYPPSGSQLVAAQHLTASLKINCPIKTVGPISNTHDEAVAVSSLAKKLGWKTIILVTSPTHSRRATLVFQRAGRELGWKVLSLPSTETDYDLENLSRPSERLSAFASAIHERIGIAMYRARGWI